MKKIISSILILSLTVLGFMILSVNPVFAAGYNVAIYGASHSDWISEVQSKIDSTGMFSQVDAFDVSSDVPTLTELQDYDAVLVFSDYGFDDNEAMGDVLADYMDVGGGVVAATFTFWTSDHDLGLGGRISTDDYLPFVQGSQRSGSALTMIKDLSSHPILSGVSTFRYQQPLDPATPDHAGCRADYPRIHVTGTRWQTNQSESERVESSTRLERTITVRLGISTSQVAWHHKGCYEDLICFQSISLL